MSTAESVVPVSLPAIDQSLGPVFRQNFSRVDTDGSDEFDKREFHTFLEMSGSFDLLEH
jgi:hypothetical protein